ncbi:ABC transporter permease [Georhizobium sp. MAB10]|uniref:ABC transporter permease n=1 Tax=Georhizobium sp. MAB10 TaxID=3028319 RepID=UPI003855F3DE
MAELQLSDKSAAISPVGPSLWQNVWVRRVVILLLIGAVWQATALWQNNPIMLPSLTDTFAALINGLAREGLVSAIAASLTTLIKGYVLSVLIALVLVALATTNDFLRETLQTLTAMFNPLPAIALLPLALLWFGLGEASLLFVIAHSVVWPFALAALTGFQSVPETQRMVGRNIGLTGFAYVWQILIPSALPSLISGLKIAWAFAWRTLIAAELIFGVTATSGGLGWYIFRNRNELYTDKVFAGLAVVILIGLVVELVIFKTLEQRTIRRWGMQR